MPTRTTDQYSHVPETKESLDWAELVTLDLSLFNEDGGKQELVKQLDHAARHVGFFYVKNFNISQDEVDRQFALGREFYDLPLEEKLKYHSRDDLDKVEYNGCRPAGHRILGNGIKDNVQVYNIPKFDGHHHRRQPDVIAEHIDEIESFSRRGIRRKTGRGGGGLYSPGHTDLGSITLLFRQPVAALQILDSQGNWKWVRPQDGTITINTCDALTALTGGLIKSSIHRVHVPPADQAHLDRLGVLYSARPNNHVVLDTITNSPVLNRLGLTQNAFTELGQHLTTEQWVKVRQTQQQRRRQDARVSADGSYTYSEKDLQIIPGLQAKLYN